MTRKKKIAPVSQISVTMITLLISTLVFVFFMFFKIFEDQQKFAADEVERDRVTYVYDRMARCSETLSEHWNNKTTADTIISQMDECIGTKEWQEFKTYRDGKEETMAMFIRRVKTRRNK